METARKKKKMEKKKWRKKKGGINDTTLGVLLL
jgi:hypothetical protein